VTTRFDPISRFITERNAVLLRGDVEECVAFLLKHNPGMVRPSPAVAELMMHKAITGCVALPVAYRRASAHWLLRRGYRSFDDGDL
jgi:hypothetical protein